MEQKSCKQILNFQYIFLLSMPEYCLFLCLWTYTLGAVISRLFQDKRWMRVVPLLPCSPGVSGWLKWRQDSAPVDFIPIQQCNAHQRLCAFKPIALISIWQMDRKACSLTWIPMLCFSKLCLCSNFLWKICFKRWHRRQKRGSVCSDHNGVCNDTIATLCDAIF